MFLQSKMRANSALRAFWTPYRCYQLYRSYDLRREYYARIACERKVVYRETEVVAAVQHRIRDRGHALPVRPIGEVHTFAIMPQFSWHPHLLPDLWELGPVSLFDYVSLGYGPEDFCSPRDWDRQRVARRQEMLSQILPALQKAHEERPVDWVFCYAGGQTISVEVVDQISERFGVPTVNMSLDDKQGWAGPRAGQECTGARDITAAFDLFMTSARVACEWHLVEGGRPIYMPEGFDASSYKPRDVQQDIPVSFVGGAYGFRPSVVRYLLRHGVPIQAFGQGWPGAGYVEDLVEVFNRSVINLGMGGIGYSERLTNVKGRDFEIPGTGGGVYLTSFNPDLAQHFVIGEEVLCYRNRDEMLELIRYYLAHPDEARAIAQRGRERCLREHRWLHRYQRMLCILGILPNIGDLIRKCGPGERQQAYG